MKPSKKVHLTLDEDKLMSLFAGGNYGGRKASTRFALNALFHARATVNVLHSHVNADDDLEVDQKKRNDLLYYLECQLEFAEDVVNALEGAEKLALVRESEAAE